MQNFFERIWKDSPCIYLQQKIGNSFCYAKQRKYWNKQTEPHIPYTGKQHSNMLFQAKLSYLRKHPLILLHAGCFLTFTAQMIVLAMNQISPSTTISHLEERNLDSIDFPVLFKICIKPAFNNSELYKAGYKNIWHYFLGQSRYNESVFGWGGHTDNGSIIGTAGGKGVELWVRK